jgi:hypothetical protein
VCYKLTENEGTKKKNGYKKGTQKIYASDPREKMVKSEEIAQIQISKPILRRARIIVQICVNLVFQHHPSSHLLIIQKIQPNISMK